MGTACLYIVTKAFVRIQYTSGLEFIYDLRTGDCLVQRKLSEQMDEDRHDGVLWTLPLPSHRHVTPRPQVQMSSMRHSLGLSFESRE